MNLKIIYETTGAAAEYAPLGLNLTRGCIFGCKYCYGPMVTHSDKELFHGGPYIKDDAIERVTADAKKLQAAGDKRLIQISFIGDPCQTMETVELTRQALTILGGHGLNATILTKGGMEAEPLFPVLGKYGFSFGTSLVWFTGRIAVQYEPDAACVDDRCDAIYIAYTQGIKTWVSLEPVIDPNEAIALIGDINDTVDHWKVGKISHNPELEKAVDWHKFYHDVTALLDSVEADYIIKESLRKYA